jgi:23S rRNA (guanosine2251-2'-O)-methyltransferase
MSDAGEDLVFGIHAVERLLTEAPRRVRVLWVQKGLKNRRLGELIEIARDAGLRVEFTERRTLDARANGAHQGIVADCHAVALADEADLMTRYATFGAAPLILALDGVLDPRNLGACLRSAEAAGVDAVLLPKRRSAPVTGAARKTASGAAETLFLVSVTNLVRRLEWLKAQGAWVVGAAGDAPSAWSAVDLAGPTVLVVGGEEKGLKALTRKTCDVLVAIPMQGQVNSLNVSVAAGVLLFEAVRQRLATNAGAP